MNEEYVIIWFERRGSRPHTLTDPDQDYRPVAAAREDIVPVPTDDEFISTPEELDAFLAAGTQNTFKAVPAYLVRSRLGWDVTYHKATV